jgi:hypothetical protein
LCLERKSEKKLSIVSSADRQRGFLAAVNLEADVFVETQCRQIALYHCKSYLSQATDSPRGVDYALDQLAAYSFASCDRIDVHAVH